MTLILTLVGMATTTMLQLQMNHMDLASKRMGKIAIFSVDFYSAYITRTQQMIVSICSLASLHLAQLFRVNKKSTSRYGIGVGRSFGGHADWGTLWQDVGLEGELIAEMDLNKCLYKGRMRFKQQLGPIDAEHHWQPFNCFTDSKISAMIAMAAGSKMRQLPEGGSLSRRIGKGTSSLENGQEAGISPHAFANNSGHSQSYYIAYCRDNLHRASRRPQIGLAEGQRIAHDAST